MNHLMATRILGQGESGGFILSKFCSMVHPELKKLFLLSIEAAAIESAL